MEHTFYPEVLGCRMSDAVDDGGATMSRNEEVEVPGEAKDAVDMILDPRSVRRTHTC